MYIKLQKTGGMATSYNFSKEYYREMFIFCPFFYLVFFIMDAHMPLFIVAPLFGGKSQRGTMLTHFWV